VQELEHVKRGGRVVSGDNSQWQEASYEEDYHRSVHGKLIEDSLYYELKAREAEADLFEGIPADAEVFEFGVGLGKNIARRERKAGYDLSQYARSFSSQHGIQVFENMADVANERFDVVLISHVLEHLEDPFENLQLLRSKLKPGGKLIVVLPTERHRLVPFEVDADQHLYAWNFRTLNNLLQRAGFKVLKNRYRYATAQYKLRHLGKLSFALYRMQTQLLGRLFNRRDMIALAEKC
jgi:SAM-dependent methyltransferase